MNLNGYFTKDTAKDLARILHRAFPDWKVFICCKDGRWAVGWEHQYGYQVYFYSYAQVAISFICKHSKKDGLYILDV